LLLSLKTNLSFLGKNNPYMWLKQWHIWLCFFVKWSHEPYQLDQLSDNKADDTESEVEKEKDEDADLVASEELEDDSWENAPKASMNSLNVLLFQLAANSFIESICCQCSHDFKQHILH